MKIPFGQFELELYCEEDIQLPTYKGSTFRGGFGVAFRRVVCALRRQDCSDCILRSMSLAV